MCCVSWEREHPQELTEELDKKSCAISTGCLAVSLDGANFGLFISMQRARGNLHVKEEEKDLSVKRMKGDDGDDVHKRAP